MWNINNIANGKRQYDEKNGHAPFNDNVELVVGMYPHIFFMKV